MNKKGLELLAQDL